MRPPGRSGATARTARSESSRIRFPGVEIIERFLLADVHADLPVARDTVSVWLRGAEMLAAFPLPGADLWRLMAPAPDGAPDELSPQAVVDLLTRSLQEHSHWPASAVRGEEWTSTFRIQRRLADRYRHGRMLLAGDAAHIHSPLGGQGMNTGLGDAENLAWKLTLVARRRAEPALLDSYEAERRPIAADVLESTSAMTRMVAGESRLARVLRDHVFVPLLHRPTVQRLIWEQASQLKVSYRSAPLTSSARRPFRSRPRCGERVPDLTCRRSDGSPTRLHAELGSRWVLLARPPSTRPAAFATQACISLTRRRLGPELVSVLTPSHAHGANLMLVRPDAHLAWRGSPSTAALEGWLAGMLDHGSGRGPDDVVGGDERVLPAGAVRS